MNTPTPESIPALYWLADHYYVIPIAMTLLAYISTYLFKNSFREFHDSILNPKGITLIVISLILSLIIQFEISDYVYDQKDQIEVGGRIAYIEDIIYKDQDIIIEPLKREDVNFVYYRIKDNEGKQYTLMIEKYKTFDVYDYTITEINQ